MEGGGFGGSREFKSEVKEFKIAKAISFKYIFSRVTHKKWKSEIKRCLGSMGDVNH